MYEFDENPLSVWQKIGRASRDGSPGKAILFTTSSSSAVVVPGKCMRESILSQMVGYDKFLRNRSVRTACAGGCDVCLCCFCTCCSECMKLCRCFNKPTQAPPSDDSEADKLNRNLENWRSDESEIDESPEVSTDESRVNTAENSEEEDEDADILQLISEASIV